MASTERLPSGRYRGVYYDPIAKKYHRVRGTFTSKREAQRLANTAELTIRTGTYRNPDDGRITYSEYFEQHWLPNKLGERNTISAARSHYNVEIKQAFGNVRLEDITTDRVQAWITAMLERGTTPATARKRVFALSAVLGAKRGVSAVRSKRIKENPCRNVELPVVSERDPDVYTPSEAFRLFERLPNWYRPLATLAVETGWRWGELNGLWVSDFTDDFHVLRLNRTLLEIPVSKTGLPSPFSHKDHTKEKRSRRPMELSPEVAAEIRLMVKMRKLFPGDRLFSVPADQTCMLPKRTELWPSGQPISRGNFRTRQWLPAHIDPETGEQDIPQRRFHDLRGANISWLIAAGVDIGAIQERVGHKDLRITQRYHDTMPDRDQRVLRGMAAIRESVKQTNALALAEFERTWRSALGGSSEWLLAIRPPSRSSLTKDAEDRRT